MKTSVLALLAFAAISSATCAAAQQPASARLPTPATPQEKFAFVMSDWTFVKSTYIGCKQNLTGLNNAMNLSLARENARSQGLALTRDNFADMLRQPREDVDALVSAHLGLFRFGAQECAAGVPNMQSKLGRLLEGIEPNMLDPHATRGSDVTVDAVVRVSLRR